MLETTELQEQNRVRPSELTDDDRRQFSSAGFLILREVLEPTLVEDLRHSFERLFAGDFDTGVYPDEWYWRQGISCSDAVRHMTNAWKSSLTMAELALSGRLARIACQLAGWKGARLGQDSVWWKPPGAGPVAFHQDTSFMDFLDPQQTITCWVALDDTLRDGGTLEYATGSHRWPVNKLPNVFGGSEDYRAPMLAAAERANEPAPQTVQIEVPAGSCVFHSGEIWHGSGRNRRAGLMRRSIGLHYLPDGCRFSDKPGGYIYRRYQRTNDPELDESFFPLLWSLDHRRSAWIDTYLMTGRRQ